MFVLRYCDVAVFVSEVLSHLASFTFNIFFNISVLQFAKHSHTLS